MASQAVAIKEAEKHFQGLDLLQVRESPEVTHCAILLEFWRTGALLHTSEAIEVGTALEISLEMGFAAARAESCVAEQYGYIVTISVNAGEAWQAYCPPYVLDEEAPPMEKPEGQAAGFRPHNRL